MKSETYATLLLCENIPLVMKQNHKFDSKTTNKKGAHIISFNGAINSEIPDNFKYLSIQYMITKKLETMQ